MRFSSSVVLAAVTTTAVLVNHEAAAWLVVQPTAASTRVRMLGNRGQRPSLVLQHNEDTWIVVGSQLSIHRHRNKRYQHRFLLRAKDDGLSDDDDDYDDDEDDVFSQGVNSVSWLPTVKNARGVSSSDVLTEKGAELIPLFPLGGIVYTPNSEHTLNIFEPRYRQMYTDILMNGTKRFAVSMSHPSESGRFAQMAVLFELDDLKEVSEQTGDQIKYICNHKVTGRVKLHRILNPEDWESRATYLRAEGTIIDDSGKKKATVDNGVEEENPLEQKLLQKTFGELVELQHDVEEDVRFTRASVLSLAVKPGSGSDGLWQTIKLWQSFADQRLMARQNELQRDFQEKLQEFLKKEKGLKGEELPSAIGFQELSIELQKEVVALQKRIAIELQPLVLESTLTMQKILECEDHTARLRLVRSFIEAESKRLNTKKTILGMFADGGSSSSAAAPSTTNAAIPPEEQVKGASSSSSSASSIMIDDDAFQ